MFLVETNFYYARRDVYTENKILNVIFILLSHVMLCIGTK